MARNHNDPSFASPPLYGFFVDIKDRFLQMNGPYAPSDEMIDQDPELENRPTDCRIGACRFTPPSPGPWPNPPMRR